MSTKTRVSNDEHRLPREITSETETEPEFEAEPEPTPKARKIKEAKLSVREIVMSKRMEEAARIKREVSFAVLSYDYSQSNGNHSSACQCQSHVRLFLFMSCFSHPLMKNICFITIIGLPTHSKAMLVCIIGSRKHSSRVSRQTLQQNLELSSMIPTAHQRLTLHVPRHRPMVSLSHPMHPTLQPIVPRHAPCHHPMILVMGSLCSPQ